MSADRGKADLIRKRRNVQACPAERKFSGGHRNPCKNATMAQIGQDRVIDLSQSAAPCLLQKFKMQTEMRTEPELFRTLYDANHDRVHRLLGRIVGPQEAEDLTQLVFAKATRALPQFRGDAQASTWLYRIAVNVASDWLRSRSAREAKLTVHLPEGLDEATSQGSASVALLDINHRRSRSLSARTCGILFVAR